VLIPTKGGPTAIPIEAKVLTQEDMVKYFDAGLPHALMIMGIRHVNRLTDNTDGHPCPATGAIHIAQSHYHQCVCGSHQPSWKNTHIHP